MTQSIKTSLIFLAVLSFSSCASILSDSNYPLTINTNPAGVSVIVKNDKGVEIFNGNSPATIRLKSGDGFFKKAIYTVHVSADGYTSQTLPVNFKIDGWYWGNLLLGGVIGMLIIDPATGAMYKIEDEFMNVSLREKSTSDISTPTLEVFDIADVSNDLKEKLVRINP